MELQLPKPNEEELKSFNKADYFARVYRDNGEIRTKNKLEYLDFATWIHHNYESWITSNKSTSYNEHKKLMR